MSRLQIRGRKWRSSLPHSLAIVAVVAGTAMALNDGQCLTPPMGWNSFNQFGGNWTDADIKANADSLVSTGLRDLGYIYCNADGNNGGTSFWPGSGANMVAWAKPLSDYMHARGLKFGVYMTSSTNATSTASDCAAAEVDYLKHDDWTVSSGGPLWAQVRDALAACGRPVVYSIHPSDEIIQTQFAHVTRTCWDINVSWTSVMLAYDDTYKSLAQSGPGGWADPDMLEVGCKNTSSGAMLTDDENRAHFSMWCMMAAPLLIGYDLSRTKVSTRSTDAQHVKTMAILSNAELIAVDQDSLGKAGVRKKGSQTLEVWVKELKDGTKAVAFFNRTSAAANMTISKAELGLPNAATVYVRDLWQHTDLTPFTASFSMQVKSHAAEVFRMDSIPIVSSHVIRRMDRSIAWLARNGYEVFPQKLIPSVLQGSSQIRAFNLCGRALTVDPRLAGSGTFILRTGRDGESASFRTLWSRDPVTGTR